MPKPPESDLPNAEGPDKASLKREYKRQYHLKNRERLIAKSRKWVEDNLEKRRGYARQWVANNPDKVSKYQRDYRIRLRMLIFSRYGGPLCACCGELETLFLTVDHIDGAGGEHRKSLGMRGGHAFYNWLKKNEFPPGYRVLCFNCNMALGAYGGCPHNNL